MKQKMRIKLSVNSEKCRKKAMQVAVVADGVTSVAMEGEFQDELVVVGDGVDTASLIMALRKKACHVTLETLEEVKKPQKKPQVEEKSVTPHFCIAQCPVVSNEQPRPEVYRIVHDSYGPTTGCLVM
ncbi:hypothetical protein ISN45_Aa03g021880 [Arabidopsis thaliana x Arabidopsis arenosa]|uniref:HMA domain-containing protein n=1 Tax=Arabidopsis thaliana x Arabidopsis arenosa TaxID=1240361 RepID=A0A8T2ATL7_9BRAS|nr:hypothetical protein ISN45_Aa03g021880 [Arabidopsis thaliana x Arabidopsis arenosa]